MNSDSGTDNTQNALSLILSEIKSQGGEIIDMTASNPTILDFDYSEFFLPELLSSEDNLIYSPEAKGSMKARLAIENYYNSRKNYFKFRSPSDLILAAGTSECYSYIMKALSDVNDEVLLPAPGYPLSEHLVLFERLSPVYYRLKYDGNDFKIDFDSLEKNITTKTKFIFIISPNNPTGYTLRQSEFIRLNKICEKNGINIIIDEVFFDYIIENNYEPFLPENPVNYSIFILNGLSKITATPQLKLSWMYIIPQKGNEESIIRKIEFIADAYLSVSTPVQNAAQSLLNKRSYLQSQLISRIKNNLALLENEGFDFYKVKAGWYACIKLKQNIQDEIFCSGLLENAHVLAHPGYFYEFTDEEVIVISLIQKEEVFREGIGKIRNYSDNISSDSLLY